MGYSRLFYGKKKQQCYFSEVANNLALHFRVQIYNEY